MINTLKAPRRTGRKRGQSLTEYGIILSMIAGIVIGTIVFAGDAIADSFTGTAAQIEQPGVAGDPGDDGGSGAPGGDPLQVSIDTFDITNLGDGTYRVQATATGSGGSFTRIFRWVGVAPVDGPVTYGGSTSALDIVIGCFDNYVPMLFIELYDYENPGDPEWWNGIPHGEAAYDMREVPTPCD